MRIKIVPFVIILFSIIKFVDSKETDLSNNILNLQQKVISVHNKLLKKEAEIDLLNLKILSNKQKQAILKKKIKDKENILESIISVKKNELKNKRIKSIYPLLSKKTDFMTENIIKRETLEVLKEEINSFFSDFTEYENIESQISQQKTKLDLEKSFLVKFQTSLKSQLLTKNKLQKKDEIRKYKKKQTEISRRANNINDLVNETKYKQYKKSKYKNQKIRLPVNGKIIEQFGQSNNYLTKNGMMFEPRLNSYVISPIRGTVEYAGEFRSYGKLIIIVNDKGFHTILSGMDEIITIAGNKVLPGEPIAKNNNIKKSKKRIYFELRYQGKAIDPKREVEIL